MKKMTTTKKRTPRPTRAYTRGFTPSDGIGTEIRLTQVPVSFKRGVMAKAKREGVSVRGMLLTHLQEWMAAK